MPECPVCGSSALNEALHLKTSSRCIQFQHMYYHTDAHKIVGPPPWPAFGGVSFVLKAEYRPCVDCTKYIPRGGGKNLAHETCRAFVWERRVSTLLNRRGMRRVFYNNWDQVDLNILLAGVQCHRIPSKRRTAIPVAVLYLDPDATELVHLTKQPPDRLFRVMHACHGDVAQALTVARMGLGNTGL